MKLISGSVAYFVVVILLAHLVAPPGYHWTQHTISDLAAQGYPHGWLMQAGFIGFGLLLNIAIVAKLVRTRRVSYPYVLIMLYGSSIMLSGFFSAPPIDPSIPYSTGEASLHSTFAAAAGVALSVAMLLSVVLTGQPRERLLHGSCFVAVVGLSLLFEMAESGVLQIGKGVIQRVLWTPGLAWLVALEYLGFDGVGQMPFSDHFETSMRP